MTAVNVELNKKQLAALKILLDNSQSLSLLYGGAAAGGKTWLGCVWLFFMCCQYPATRYFVARQHKSDLLESTYATFLKVLRAYGDSPTFWKLNKQEGTLYHTRNGASITFLATQYEPSDPQFNRFGSKEYTGGWLEECQETSRLAYTVLATRVGRCRNAELGLKSKILLTCNPSRNWLYSDFYKPFIASQLPSTKAVVLATMQDNLAYLPPDYVERMQQIEDPQTRQRLTEGLWDFDDDPQFLIPSRLTTQALDVPAEDGPISVGIDIALGGLQSDRTVIARLAGNKILEPIIIPASDYTGDPANYDNWLAEYLARWIGNTNIAPQNVKIDASGVGDKIIGILKQRYRLPVYGFYGSAPAFPRPRKKMEFKNLRAQCYWELKEKFRNYHLHLPIDYNEQMIEELVNQKYTITDQKIALEDKIFIRRRLGRSPDLADALALAAFELPSHAEAVQAITAKREAAKTGGPRFRNSGGKVYHGI